jgi:hypothetical protein
VTGSHPAHATIPACDERIVANLPQVRHIRHSTERTIAAPATIGIGAFLGRASTVLRRRSEEEVQRATMYGGLAGLIFALFLVLIDTIAG